MECELLIRLWRTLVSYSTELYFHLTLADVSIWIDWGYELLGRVLQRWCALLKAHAHLLQSCPTLCHPADCSPPGTSVHRILQAGILEWVATPSSRGSSQPRDQIPCLLHHVDRTADRFFTPSHWENLIVILQFWISLFIVLCVKWKHIYSFANT